MQQCVDELNARLNRWETIKQFRILDRDLSVEEGELTPSLKVKRAVVEKRFADLIESMYGSDGVTVTARLDVLVEGYAGDRVASSVVLVRDGDAVVVVDPGMVASRAVILGPAGGAGRRAGRRSPTSCSATTTPTTR